MSKTQRISKRTAWALGLGLAAVTAVGGASAGLLGPRAAIAPSAPTSAVPWRASLPGLRLHVFETGRMVIDGWMVAVGGEGKRVMDQPAYVIEHPTAGLFMFEAGHHSAIATSPGEHLGWIHAAGLMPMEQERGQDARSQMAAAGLDPLGVRGIIVSHFHPEHVGAVEEMPHASVIADAREVRHGLMDPDYNYVRGEYDDVKRWQELSFEGSAAFGPFPGAVDLLGDGSIVVVSTPGHTPGHVSVAVNLPEGPVLLTGDVAWTELNIQSGTIGLPFISSDGAAARASLGQLLQFRAENPEVLLVPGHDLAPLRRAARGDVALHPWPASSPTKAPTVSTTASTTAAAPIAP